MPFTEEQRKRLDQTSRRAMRTFRRIREGIVSEDRPASSTTEPVPPTAETRVGLSELLNRFWNSAFTEGQQSLRRDRDMDEKAQLESCTDELRAMIESLFAENEKASSPAEPVPGDFDWIESAERDYAMGSYEFFGQEWGERLILAIHNYRAELSRLREQVLTAEEAQLVSNHRVSTMTPMTWLDRALLWLLTKCGLIEVVPLEKESP